MIFHKPVLLIITLIAFAVAEAKAEQKAQNAEPGPPSQIQVEAATQTDPGNQRASLKSAALRVWYFGSQSSPRITVACAPVTGDPVALGSFIPVGRMLSYRPLRPGTYSVAILDGSVVPSAENGKISIETKKLAAFNDVNLAASTFHTLIIYEKDGKFSIEPVTDKLPPPGTPALARVFNFSDDNSLSISIGEPRTGKENFVWKGGGPSPTNIPALNGPNPFIFYLCNSSNGEPATVTAFEATIDQGSALSLVIFKDRHGNLTMRGIKDASGSFDSNELGESP